MMSNESMKLNERIIEELTKDVEDSCIKVEEIGDDTEPEGRTVKMKVPLDKLVSEESNSKKDENSETKSDFVDEDLLKNRESSLSEDEKDSLKNEAEKCKTKGNELFNKGEYKEAMSMYTLGLQTCPLAYTKERSILYSNRAAAKLKCLDRESAITDCTKAIELNPSYVKTYVRRAQLYEAMDKLDEALEDFKKVLTFDPSHVEAHCAIQRLHPLIEGKNEKLQKEMLGQLKSLGNMVLQPFGLSTDNFKLEKKPDGDGYSVKFCQNPN